MRTLSEVPFDKLKLNDKILSVRNVEGKIVELIPKEKATRQEDNEVVIHWDNGNKSHLWHFWATNVKYMQDN